MALRLPEPMLAPAGEIPHGRGWIAATSVTVGTFLVYLLTLSRNHSENEDSLNFASQVGDGTPSDFLSGLHLAYKPFAWGLFSVARGIGLTDDPLLFLQILDALLAAVGVGLLVFLLLSVGVGPSGVLAAAGLVAFGYGYWRNGVVVEVYSLSALLLIASLLFAQRAWRRPTPSSFALVGIVSGLAVLAHVTNVLFGFVVVLAVMLARSESFGVRMRWVAIYGTVASAVVIAGYAAAAVTLRLRTPDAFWSWFTVTTGEGYGNVTPKMAIEASAGIGRALIGGHAAFALDPITELAFRALPGKTLVEERFLVAETPAWLAVLLLVTAAAACLLLLIVSAQWAHARRLPPSRRVLALLCLAWLVPYTALFAWWDPANIELWYVFWIPVATLLGIGLDATTLTGRTKTGLAGALVVLVFATNLLGSALPQADPENDYWWKRSTWYRTNTGQADVIVANNFLWVGYLRHFTQARTIDLDTLFDSRTDEAALAKLRAEVERLPAQTVFFSDEALHPFRHAPSGCIAEPRWCEYGRLVRHAFRGRTRLIAQLHGERVWVVDRAAALR